MLWAHACAASPHGLGLTSEQFWSATPREIEALSQVKEAADKVALWRWGYVCMLFANAWLRSKDHHPEPFTVEDFIGGKSKKPDETKFKIVLRQSNMIRSDQVPEWAKGKPNGG